MQPSDPAGARPPERRRTPLAGVRVLLVEDDPDTAEVVATMLAHEGAEVVHAPNASSALAELDQHGFDVIVTDYALGPGHTGFELVEAVRRQPVDARVPVIGYSAHGGLVPADQQAAFNVYAAKTMFVDNVVGLVRGVVQRRGIQRHPA